MDDFPALKCGVAGAVALDFIPTIGSSGMILSYREVFRYLFHAKELVQEGYTKYPDSMFRIPGVERWNVIVTGRLSNAGSETYSTRQFLQIGYTAGPVIDNNDYHTTIVRTDMTRNIGALFPAVWDEIVTAFDEIIPVQGSGEWASVPAYDAAIQIVTRTTNRLFVGLPLCRDPDYINLNVNYAMDVIIAGQIINLMPLLGPLVSPRKRFLRRADKHITPVVTERVRKEQELGPNYADRPNDLVSWLIDGAEGEAERTIPALVERAVRTSADVFAHALYDLAAYPEYVEPLREEIETITRKEGWTRASLGRMYKTDSFMYESLRYNGIGTLSLSRKVVKPEGFTFSDGINLPYGTYLYTPMWSIHHDPEIYPDPHVFDGFRFSKLRDSDDSLGAAKFQAVTTSLDYQAFGHGRHACPGRFFAVIELKAMLAHVVMNY
ncbi:cytochrome P450 [Mycena rebaudengoi]|nr:cytochrome P450 [Mycena rebaudengoi]